MQHNSLKPKRLLLLAVLGSALAGPASAQTSVTISGLLDTFAGSIRMAGDASRTSVVNSSGMTTSWFGFKGTEELGGGLKANFALTSFIQTDTGTQGRFGGDTLFSRDANVGLAGNFGSLTLGRALSPSFLPTILFNPFGDSFTFSPLILQADVPLSSWGNSLAGDTGWSNEILYTTPTFNGLTANMHYQLGEVAGDAGKHNVGGNLLYFHGPLALTAFYHNVKVNNPLPGTSGNVGFGAGRESAWMVGGSYDLTAAKLFATYGQTSHDVDLQDKTLSLGVSIPAGQGKVEAGWAQTKRSGAVIGAAQKRNTATIGYDYDLSKRTDLYAMLMNDKVTAQQSGNSIGVGIRHRF